MRSPRHIAPYPILAAAVALAFAGLQPAAAQPAAAATDQLAAAQPAATAKARPLMTFSRPGEADRALTRADFEAMPRHVIETGTPWQNDRSRFEGVKMSDLFRALGVDKDGAVMVGAINGYAAEFPVKEGHDYDVILAFRKDGKELSVREKGPLFIVYNFDLEKGRIAEAQNARAVWQVVSMRVR